jgi:hypothetical protein
MRQSRSYIQEVIIFNNKYGFRFMNQYLDIRKAPEPEVVNWENQHVTIFARFWKTLIVLFIMLISLAAVLATLAAT